VTEATAALPQQHRLGDAIAIDGGYQHRALKEGFVVQRFWHAEKSRMIGKFSRPHAGERVLDIGCGSGVISDVLRSFGASVIAIDGNRDAIAYARRTFGDRVIEFRLGQVDEVTAEPGSIDRSYCLEVIEHLYVNQVESLFTRVRDLTRPAGTLTLTTPNYRGVWQAIEWTLDALNAVPHLDGDQHVTRFTSSRLRSLLEQTGWRVDLMTTFSTVAPWLSIAGWKLAERVASFEDRMSLSWGSILFAVATRVHA